MALAVKAASIAAVAGPIALGVGFASLAAHAVALTAAVAPAVNIVAMLPAGLIAAGAGFAAMKIATGGLGDAMKQTAGGGAAVGAAVAAAEKRIAMAQREAAAAQLNLNDARLTAAERLDDMHRSLARARLDEEAATMAVADAEMAVRAASTSRDPRDHAKADLAYRESLQTLTEVRDRLEDTKLAEEKASAAGVEGSDLVKSALQRQADAMTALAEAQAALKKASQGGGGVDKAAQAYAKLSPAGKQLVDVLKQLRPEWEGVHRAVQQATFVGVAGDVKALGATWFPILKTQLSGVGSAWNKAMREAAGLANSKKFVTDMNGALGNTVTFSDRLASSLKPILNAFAQFAIVGSTFMPQLGSSTLSVAEKFERWAVAARESGRMAEWIGSAISIIKQLGAIALDVGGIIAGIFRAGSDGGATLAGFADGLAKLNDFVNSPAGQGKIAAVFTTLRDIGSQLWAVLTNIGPVLLDAFSSGGAASDTMSVFSVVIGFAADHVKDLAYWLPVIVTAFIAYKTIMAGAVVVEAIRIPLLIAQVVSNFALAAAMRANMVATGQATVAQWSLNAAFLANPVGLIILAIILLIAGIVLLWENSAGFRDFFIGLWDVIWSFLKGVGHWFANDFVGFFVDGWNWLVNAGVVAFLWIHNHIQAFIDFVTGLGGQIAAGARGMWDSLVNGLRAAINVMIGLWNRLDFGISITAPAWLGGGTYSIPDIIPDLPLLAKGGNITSGGMAVVGDAGPEIVNLPRGASVTPLSRAGGGGGGDRLVIDVTGADEDLKRLIRKWVRLDGGTGPDSVQLAFGKPA